MEPNQHPESKGEPLAPGTAVPAKAWRLHPVNIFTGLAACLGLAACIALLLGPNHNDSYFQENYPGTYIPKTSDRNDPSAPASFVEGLNAFEKGDFPVAIKALEKVPESAPEFVESQVLLASAMLQDENPKDGIRALKKALEDPEFRPAARWLTALGYLHQGKKAKAEPYLQEIARSENAVYKREEARTILGTLGLKWESD